MTTKASKPSKTVVSTLGSPPRPSQTPRVSENPINGSPTAKIGFVSTVRSRLTANGELMRQKPDWTWDATTARADWDRIDSTTDAEIERQEIADLVEAALHLQVGGLAAMAARLDVSPSSVRRWRRARVMPSVVHQQRLHHLLTTLPAGDLLHDRSHP